MLAAQMPQSRLAGRNKIAQRFSAGSGLRIEARVPRGRHIRYPRSHCAVPEALRLLTFRFPSVETLGYVMPSHYVGLRRRPSG